MKKIVEFIPNFSVSRQHDEQAYDKLLETAREVKDCLVLDFESDGSHNRSVMTLIGSPEAIEEVAFRLARTAMENIDLNKHHGEHPRMGAVDVMPFVPQKGVTIQECVELSKRVAGRIWDELKIPSFLYEDSCTRENTRNLAAIRKGEFEGMNEKLQLEEWAPDFGERKVHETAGIVAIGARMPLVAFNVNLDTPDVEIAKKIAKAIRASSGGFRCCKALGIKLEERNIAQVSMNMTDFNTTPLYYTFEMIKMLAERYGVRVIGSEIIGLTPAKALIDCAEHYLKIEDFSCYDQVLEYRLLSQQEDAVKLADLSITDFNSELSGPSAAPGGGSTAAIEGSFGASLIAMVCELTLANKKYEKDHAQAAKIKTEALELQKRLLRAIDEDTEAFNMVSAAFAMPKDDDEKKKIRSVVIQEGLKACCLPPLSVMESSLEGLQLAKLLMAGYNTSTASDLGTGILSLKSAARGAYLNVLINVGSIKDEEYAKQKRDRAEELIGKIDVLADELYEEVVNQIEG